MVPLVCFVKVAIIPVSELIVVEQVPLPVQLPPDQPEKTDPLSANAVSVTTVP
jgi:hypothetical protein